MLKLFLLSYLTLSYVLYYEAFTSQSFTTSEEWTLQGANGIYSDCGGQRILGGFNNFAYKATIMKLIQLPPHHTIQITFDFWKIDSWDSEKFYVFIDENPSYEQIYTTAGNPLCGGSWGEQIISISLTQTHQLQSVFILMSSNLNSSPIDESWGIRNFKLYVHQCPAGCFTCEPTDSRNDCIPWTLYAQSFVSVSPIQMSIDGWQVVGGFSQYTNFASANLLGGTGKCGKSCVIQNSLSLPPHYLIKVKMRTAFVDTWENEYLYFKIDNSIVYQILHDYNVGQVRNFQGSVYDDYTLGKFVDIAHSSHQILLSFSNNLDESATNESMGIRDVEIFVYCKFGNSFNQACTQICGNNLKEGSELCDDGNIYPFDGCFNCQFSCVEGCKDCIEGICFDCQNEWKFQDEQNECHPNLDDEIIVVYENCDDIKHYPLCLYGQFQCPLNCIYCFFGVCQQCAKQYILFDNQCQAVCQNLTIINQFQCYDDNLDTFDGCHQCQLQQTEGCLIYNNGNCIQCFDNWIYDYQQQKCVPECGNKIINGNEECDVDQFQLKTLQYGCQSCQYNCQNECLNCQFGQCYDCIQGWQVGNYKCIPECGNGLIQQLEECDDSNQKRLDGCNSCKNDCQEQCSLCIRGECLECIYGWYLDNNSICQTFCGDSKIALISWEECDDNNINLLDGCFQCKIICQDYCQTCFQGICFECMYSFTLINNKCISICGDGQVSIDFEECDDMNEIPFDGCFECQYQCPLNCRNCMKGICYDDCDYGFYLIVNNCQTICGDGIIAGQEQCENNYIQQNGQYCYECIFICPNYCDLCQEGICKFCEIGYELNIYSNICISNCGNGIVTNNEECDDGNLRNGDGCSEACVIETNFICKNFYNTISQCIYEKQPQFILRFLEQRNEKQYVSIIFSQLVKTKISQTFSDYIQLSLIDVNEDDYEINLIVIYEATDVVAWVEYKIEVTIKKSLDFMPYLNVKLQETLYNINEAKLINQNEKIRLQIPKYLDDQVQKAAEDFKNINKYLIDSMGSFGLIALFFGGTFIFESVLEVLQQQSYLRFINVKFPFNLFIYFESSNIITIQPILNFFNFQSIAFAIETFYLESYEKFKYYGINSDIFTNIQTQLFQLLLLFIVYYTCKILITLLPVRKQFKGSKILQMLERYFQKLEFLCSKFIQTFHSNRVRIFLIANCWDIIFSVLLQIKASTEYSYLSRVQLGIILAFILYYFGFFTTLTTIQNNIFKKQSFYNYWRKLINFFVTLKKFLFLSILTLFQKNQQIQTILLSLISLLTLSYYVRFKPFSTIQQHLIFFITEASVFFFVVTVMFYWEELNTVVSNQKQILFGWIHIAVLVSVIFINLLIQIYETIKVLLKLLKSNFFISRQQQNKAKKSDPFPLKNVIIQIRF